MAVRRELLTIEDISGVWAILPTPAKPGASEWRMDDTVDLDETARAVDALIEAGVGGILTLGTLGEAATLTWEEKRRFIATGVEAARGRVPFFAGTTSLGTRESIRQTREAHLLGADGTMLGLPMWCTPEVPTAVKFFQDVAEACPEMAICVYANPMAFRFAFPPSFWAQIADLPQVVTAKYGPISRLLTDVDASRMKIRFMPNDFDYYAAAKLDPEFFTAFWTSGAVCGPSVVNRLHGLVEEAKKTCDWKAAKELSDRIGRATAPMFPRGNLDEFSKYNIGIEKEKMNAAGWMHAGPCRPPYTYLPDEYAEGARTAGRMWADLEQECRLLSNPVAR